MTATQEFPKVIDGHEDFLTQMRRPAEERYDGTFVPSVLGDATKLPNFLRALKQHGYRDDEIEAICQGNFLRVLRQVWN
ncbi:MAG: membrane dipeptidase [Dehalococcoidia bacterium]